MLKIQLYHQRIKYILKYIKIKKSILKCNNISHYYCFYYISDQINAALVENLTDPKLER